MIREAERGDLAGLLRLYTHLHGNPLPERAPTGVWEEILSDPRHHVVVAEEAGEIVSSCVLVVVPNLTHGQRPYALMENVVTREDFRGRGLATRCLDFARGIAEAANCYKIMLLTGSKEERTLRFYERAGYNRRDKTAFIQWLD
jgi:GNAT superfamily N-acetyltransferase